MNITVTIADKASPVIAEQMKNVRSRSLHAAAGAAGQLSVQQHLGNLDAVRENKLGGKRTHFFASAARGTTYKTTDDGADVNIYRLGIRLQLLGGTVHPVNKKYLTIPARAEAHGKSAGEFDNLEVMWGRSGPIGLMARKSQNVSFEKNKEGNITRTVKGRKQGGVVFFWFAKSATLQPDPTVIPSEQDLTLAVKMGIYSYLNRKAG